MKGIINSLICLSIISLSTIICHVTVLGPPTLVTKMKNYDTGSGSIDYQLGNFGEIPYGKTVVGYTYYHKNSDGKNTWCDFEKTSTPSHIEKDPDNEYSPIFLVDYSEDCSLVRKAYNVRARGGRVMVLISNDRSFKEERNVDDQLGDRVDIPTVIIKKDEGDELKTFIENSSEQVIMSIKFTGMKKSDVLTIELFMRSDDLKSLHFFREFERYYFKLKSKINFVPHYKYYRYSWEVTSNNLSTKDSTAPCVKDTKYCAHENPALKIYNARIVLMENLRQSCIYKTYKSEDLDTYWAYMMNFSDTCVDINNPLFTEDCAYDMMKYSGVKIDTIKQCMEDSVKSLSGPIETDYQAFNGKKVHKVPEVMLNGIKYKGSWLAKYIFDAICSGFLDDDVICATPKPEDLGGDSGIGVGGIMLIVIFIFIVMLVLLICYRRIVNKSLEASLNEKIQTQTIHSLGQYQVFKDESTGRKMVDVTKL